MVDGSILSQWMVNVGRRDAKTRIAHLLPEVVVRYGAVGQSEVVLFDFPLT